MGIEVFRGHGPARAKALEDYAHYAITNDLFLTYVIVISWPMMVEATWSGERPMKP